MCIYICQLCEEEHRGTHTPGRIYNNNYYKYGHIITSWYYIVCVYGKRSKTVERGTETPTFCPLAENTYYILIRFLIFLWMNAAAAAGLLFFLLYYIINSPPRVPVYIIISGTRRVCDFRHTVVVYLYISTI